MLLGYARVSDASQHHDLQMDALRAAGCERIFVETASGVRADRPELSRLMEAIRGGDTLVVWRLDRLGRSLRHLIDLSEQLQRRGVALRSLTEAIDTATPAGRFLFSILGALASMEREIIVERTRAGLAASRLRGRVGGRPRALDHIAMTMRYSHLMTEHLHEAMGRYGANSGTNPGTGRADTGGGASTEPRHDAPAEDAPAAPTGR